MCFSNLPIEFDENGDPYLAETADDVERPACECAEDERSLAEDPVEAYEALMESVSTDVREHLREAPRMTDSGPHMGGD